MPKQVLSVSDGTGASGWEHVADTDDLIMGISPGAATTNTVDAEIKLGGNAVHVSGSTVSGEGTTSLDLIPDGSSVRANVSAGSADVFFHGNYFGR